MSEFLERSSNICPEQLIIAAVASRGKAAQTGSVGQMSTETKTGAMSLVRQDGSVFEARGFKLADCPTVPGTPLSPSALYSAPLPF